MAHSSLFGQSGVEDDISGIIFIDWLARKQAAHMRYYFDVFVQGANQLYLHAGPQYSLVTWC